MGVKFWYVRGCLHVPSPCPCPSYLHCLNGDGPFDGENGFLYPICLSNGPLDQAFRLAVVLTLA